MTFCDQRSTLKVRFFSFFCTNKWQIVVLILVRKSLNLCLLGFIFDLFKLNIDPDEDLK